jgi:farnesyl diphosphate synthase
MPRTRARVEAALAACLPAASELAPELIAAMRHAVLAGGKRLRPLLVCAAAESLCGDSESGFERAADAACAIELVHAYSLIHDDLPAMDDDVLRHGQPSCHVAFGEAVAILAGDALQALAFERLATAPAHGAEARLAMVSVLADAAGWRGMVGGQARDITSTGHPLDARALEQMHAAKTGALLRAAVELGAIAGGASARQRDMLGRFGARMGLAFQIVDDLLDATSTTATLGKTAGADAAAGKTTYPALIGVEASRARAADLLRDARADLAQIGLAGGPLDMVATVLVDRTY